MVAMSLGGGGVYISIFWPRRALMIVPERGDALDCNLDLVKS